MYSLHTAVWTHPDWVTNLILSVPYLSGSQANVNTYVTAWDQAPGGISDICRLECELGPPVRIAIDIHLWAQNKA